VQHDLDHLRVVVSRELDGANIFFAHMTALAHDLGGEADSNIRLWIVGDAVAVGGNLDIVQFSEIFAEISVSRQAVVAAVNLGDRKRDALARRRRQGAFAERAGQAEVTLQRGGAGGHETEQIWHDAKLFVDSFGWEAAGASLIAAGVGMRDMAGFFFRLSAGMADEPYLHSFIFREY
jgi:hypothetical protein